MPLTQQQFDQYVRERQIYEQQHQHNLLKQVKKMDWYIDQEELNNNSIVN